MPGRLIPDKEILQQGPKALKGVVQSRTVKSSSDMGWVWAVLQAKEFGLDLVGNYKPGEMPQSGLV